jgi:malate synthase
LLQIPDGTRTEAGLRLNVRVGIQYLEAWLGGSGAVPLYNLMEDAATAEISRSQVWQWIHHHVALDDGTAVTSSLVDTIVGQELAIVREAIGHERFDAGRFGLAAELFKSVVSSIEIPPFLTTIAYGALESSAHQHPSA